MDKKILALHSHSVFVRVRYEPLLDLGRSRGLPSNFDLYKCCLTSVGSAISFHSTIFSKFMQIFRIFTRIYISEICQIQSFRFSVSSSKSMFAFNLSSRIGLRIVSILKKKINEIASSRIKITSVNEFLLWLANLINDDKVQVTGWKSYTVIEFQI